MFHGQISYSLVDNFLNNRVIEDASYIVEIKDDAVSLKNDYLRTEAKMNEWYTIDFYAKTREHVYELLKAEEIGIKQMFAMMRRKDQMQNLLNNKEL